MPAAGNSSSPRHLSPGGLRAAQDDALAAQVLGMGTRLLRATRPTGTARGRGTEQPASNVCFSSTAEKSQRGPKQKRVQRRQSRSSGAASAKLITKIP